MTHSHKASASRHDGTWLTELCAPFASASAIAADASDCRSDELPTPFRALLNHTEHMTAKLGAFWGEPVDLEVLELRHDGEDYVREIALRLPSDGRVVEYGVAKLHLCAIPPAAREEILERGRPLGEVLIRHNVLRRIEPTGFWRFLRSAALRDRVGRPVEVAYGRTGVIYCDGEPAIELLEVVIDPDRPDPIRNA